MSELFKDTPLYEYAQRVASSKGQEPSIFKAVLDNREVEDLIIRLNTEDQIQAEGIDTEGNIIGTYTFATELITGGRKQAGEPYDLTDTGEFIDSWVVHVRTGEIEILTNPFKVDPIEGTINLFEKLNNFKIVGLTEENQEKFNDFVLPLFIKDYENRFIR